MSPAPKVHLDDISDKPPVIDEGKIVLVEVTKCELKYGKESGDPYLNAQLAVVEDPEDEGTVMFDIWTLPTEKEANETDTRYAKRMTRRCFRLKQAALKFGVKYGSGGLDAEELAEQFVGRRAWCQTKIGKDQRDNERSEPAAYFHVNEKPA